MIKCAFHPFQTLFYFFDRQFLPAIFHGEWNHSGSSFPRCVIVQQRHLSFEYHAFLRALATAIAICHFPLAYESKLLFGSGVMRKGSTRCPSRSFRGSFKAKINSMGRSPARVCLSPESVHSLRFPMVELSILSIARKFACRMIR